MILRLQVLRLKMGFDAFHIAAKQGNLAFELTYGIWFEIWLQSYFFVIVFIY
ncbi:hypothetical protein HanHA300_Chr00c0636g0794411 [Helianthus annuus]|nr:hypothetical protein HanHA300_Chr00c0636g0794411 [Helianthus annuus]